MKRIIAYAAFLILFVHLSPVHVDAQDYERLEPLALIDVRFSPDGSQLARIFANGSVQVIDVETGALNFEMVQNLSLFDAALTWSMNSDYLVAGTGTLVLVWDTTNWQLIREFDTGKNVVADMDGYSIAEGWISLDLSPDGRLLFGETLSAFLYLWSADDLSLLYEGQIGSNPVPMAWLPDSSGITTGRSTFDVATLTINYNVVSQTGLDCCDLSLPVSIELSPDGRFFAVGDITGSIGLIDADTLQLMNLFKHALGIGSEYAVNDVAWSADGSEVLFLGAGVAKLLDIQSRIVEPLITIEGDLITGDWSGQNNLALGGYQNESGLFGLATMGLNSLNSEQNINIIFNFESLSP